MKLVALLMSITISTPAYSYAAMTIQDWNSAIPTTKENVIDVIQTEAGYFSFDTDEATCGGDVLHPTLVDHEVARTEDGNDVHNIVVKFKLTKARQYCATIEEVTCYAPIQVLSADGISMSDWTCE